MTSIPKANKTITVKHYIERYGLPPAGYRVMYAEYVVSEASYHPLLERYGYPPYQIVNEHGAVVAEVFADANLRIEPIPTDENDNAPLGGGADPQPVVKLSKPQIEALSLANARPIDTFMVHASTAAALVRRGLLIRHRTDGDDAGTNVSYEITDAGRHWLRENPGKPVVAISSPAGNGVFNVMTDSEAEALVAQAWENVADAHAAYQPTTPPAPAGETAAAAFAVGDRVRVKVPAARYAGILTIDNINAARKRLPILCRTDSGDIFGFTADELELAAIAPNGKPAIRLQDAVYAENAPTDDDITLTVDAFDALVSERDENGDIHAYEEEWQRALDRAVMNGEPEFSYAVFMERVYDKMDIFAHKIQLSHDALEKDNRALRADLAAAREQIAALETDMRHIYHIAESALRAGFVEHNQWTNMNQIFECVFKALGLTPDTPTPTDPDDDPTPPPARETPALDTGDPIPERRYQNGDKVTIKDTAEGVAWWTPPPSGTPVTITGGTFEDGEWGYGVEYPGIAHRGAYQESDLDPYTPPAIGGGALDESALDDVDSVDDDVMGATLVGTGAKANSPQAFRGTFEDARVVPYIPLPVQGHDADPTSRGDVLVCVYRDGAMAWAWADDSAKAVLIDKGYATADGALTAAGRERAAAMDAPFTAMHDLRAAETDDGRESDNVRNIKHVAPYKKVS